MPRVISPALLLIVAMAVGTAIATDGRLALRDGTDASADRDGKTTRRVVTSPVDDPNVHERRIGTTEPVGVQRRPTEVPHLRITKAGIYENFLVDGHWSNERLVRITADDVVLRHCEIRNSRQNAIEVYADDVLIENCRIHHVLRGTFDRPEDAHGITGRPRRLVVRNCEIHHVSGDTLQFDPDRQAWDEVLIENCILWTGPLESDAAGFRQGERPGENAIDTKCDPENPRSRVVIRNCLIHGWGQGQIENQAAFNLKEHVDARIENCVFRDNDICFRLRGDTGRGNADVAIRRCAIYDSKVGIRAEDRLANLRIDGLGFGGGVDRKIHVDRQVLGPGFVMHNEFKPGPIESVLSEGVAPPGE